MHPDILSGLKSLAKEGKDPFPGDWEKKILTGYPDSRQIEPYVYGQARFHFRIFLPAEKINALLEFGSGLGLLTPELAKQARKVVSYNSSRDALGFICKKKIFPNKAGFCPVNGSRDSNLPFKSQSFEAVVVPYGLLDNDSDILEEDKPVSSIKLGRKKETITALLAEFYRVLKPGGRLIFPATNKFDYERLFQMLKEKKIINNGLGQKDWQKCLRNSGFSKNRFLGVYPNWKDPEEVYLPEDISFLNFKRAGLKETIKRHAWFCSSYIVLAEKPDSKNSLNCQEAFLKKAGWVDSGDKSVFGAQRAIVTGKDKWVGFVFLDSKAAVLKVPLEEMALREEEKNLDFIKWAEKKGEVISKWVPKPIMQSQIGGLCFFLESQIPGSPFSSLVKNLGRPGAWKKIEEMLDVFLSVGESDTILEGDMYEKWVGQKLETVTKVLPDAKSAQKIKDKFKEMLWGQRLKLSVTHGDFSVSNLMADGYQNISGVFDWGWGSEAGPSFLDSLNFLDSVERLQSNNHLIDNIRMLLKEKWRVEPELKGAKEHLEKCGFGADNWKNAVYYFWLFTASARLADNFRYDSNGIQKQILDFAAEQNLV